MLRYAAIALVIALIAFVFAFFATVLAGGAVWIAKVVFAVSIGLFVIFFVIHMLKRRKKS